MLSSKAYSEVFYIINAMSDELKSKIPKELIKNIENKMDKEYKLNLENEDIENIELLEDTEKILSVLYTDYIATEEERQIIKNKEALIKTKKEAELSKVKLNEIFKKRDIEFKEQSLSKYVEKEKWYLRFWKKIRNLFK